MKTLYQFDDGAEIETAHERRTVTLPNGMTATCFGQSRGKAPVGSELGKFLFGDPDPRPKA